MHDTLVLADDYRTAESVARYYALLEVPFHKIPRSAYLAHSPGSTEFLRKHGFDPCAARDFATHMRDRVLGRIIIAGDWMGPGPYHHWHLSQPGDWVTLWTEIQKHRTRGAEVVWA